MRGASVIWCDFGGVLSDRRTDAFIRLAARCGVPVNILGAAFDAVADRFGGEGLAPLETGRLTEPQWGEMVTQRLFPDWRPRADLGRLHEIWNVDRTLNAELCDGLGERRTAGQRLAMLTNSVREWEPQRERLLGDRVPFDAVVRSHEHGVRKPDRQIFRVAEKEAGVAASDCLLIDDSPINCAAAERAGWRAILHTNNNRTLHLLDRLQ